MATARIPVRSKGQTTCLHHKTENLEFYCEKCKELVCKSCITSFHKGHSLCKLCEINDSKIRDIKTFIDKTENTELVQISTFIFSTDELLKENDNTFENFSKALRTQTEKLKQDIDLLAEETLSRYQEMKNDNANLLSKYKQNLETNAQRLEKQLYVFKKVLQKGSDIEIYDTECEIDSWLHVSVKPVLRTASFTPNENPRKHLELALGTYTSDGQGQTSTLTIQDRSVSLSHGQGQSSTQQQSDDTGEKDVSSTKQPREVTQVERWMAPCQIHYIRPNNDDQAWAMSSNTLTLLDRKGKVKQKVKHRVGITDISLSPTTHNLWVCDSQKNILELVSGHLSKRFKTKDEPICICITTDSHIIIGMPTYITKCSKRGKTELSTIATGTEEPLISPWKITECPVTNNVAVIYQSDERDGDYENRHIVVMDTKFQELFVYRGEIPSRYQEIPQAQGKPIYPRDIVYDNQGNIIIADCNNDNIFLLRGDGKERKILHTDKDEVWTAGVNSQGVLWTVNCKNAVKLLQINKEIPKK